MASGLAIVCVVVCGVVVGCAPVATVPRATRPEAAAPPARKVDPCEPSGAPGVYAASVADPVAHRQVSAILRNLAQGDEKVELETALDAFYATHGDDYDFLYLFVPDENFSIRGRYLPVAERVVMTLGVFRRGLTSVASRRPRLRAVIVLALNPRGIGGPTLHETMHHWGQYLGLIAPSLGLSAFPHWGEVGVRGQLGGFDPTRLRCLAPAGAGPPDCERAPDGRFQVIVPPFGKVANGGDGVPYAPLELYLMGLVPAAEVPVLPILVEPRLDPRSGGAAYHLYDVAGVRMLTVAEIVTAMKGERPEATANDRALRGGFVLVTPAVAVPADLERIATWARRFGAVESAPWFSFCAATGGRATMRTDLTPAAAR